MGARISVEDTLARVVRQVGGMLVGDLLPAGENLPKNADFVFKQYKVVAELKCLEKNQDEDSEITAARQSLYDRWIREGKRIPLVAVGGRKILNLRDLPRDCALEMTSLYRTPIERRIRKANEQIKSTKKNCDWRARLVSCFSPKTVTIRSARKRS
jgi:hypothetical protein